MLTQSQLKHTLYYDQVGGRFFWRNPPYASRFPPWKKAGSIGMDGYEKIQINKKTYRSNRLAWLYMTGRWPEVCTDHIDRCKTNNAWSNLREATISENKMNSWSPRKVHQLPKGVGYSGKLKKSFFAKIRVRGVQVTLGYFKTVEEASEFYMLASELVHGRFAYHLNHDAKDKGDTE